MIKILAPTTIASVDEGATVIIEMTPDVFRALAAGVQVAFDDEASTPDEHADAAVELWNFFTGQSDE